MTDLSPEQVRERTQLDALHADIALKLRQSTWEPWKALAALVSAAAAFMVAGAAIYALGQHNAERPAIIAPKVPR
jgi:hypothetical protein